MTCTSCPVSMLCRQAQAVSHCRCHIKAPRRSPHLTAAACTRCYGAGCPCQNCRESPACRRLRSWPTLGEMFVEHCQLSALKADLDAYIRPEGDVRSAVLVRRRVACLPHTICTHNCIVSLRLAASGGCRMAGGLMQIVRNAEECRPSSRTASKSSFVICT